MQNIKKILVTYTYKCFVKIIYKDYLHDEEDQEITPEKIDKSKLK